MNIGERIKQRRIELNLSQDELAQKVGYKSRSSINKIELSRSLPLSKVEKMAVALETTPSYLMGWEEAENTVKIVFSPTNEEIAIIEKYRCLPKDDKEQVINTLNHLFRYAQMVKEIQPKEGDDSEKTQ